MLLLLVFIVGGFFLWFDHVDEVDLDVYGHVR